MHPGRFRPGDQTAKDCGRRHHRGWDLYSGKATTRCIRRSLFPTAGPVRHGGIPAEVIWPAPRAWSECRLCIDAVLSGDIDVLVSLRRQHPRHHYGFEQYLADLEANRRGLPPARVYAPDVPRLVISEFEQVAYSVRLNALLPVNEEVLFELVLTRDGLTLTRVVIQQDGRFVVAEHRVRLYQAWGILTSEYRRWLFPKNYRRAAVEQPTSSPVSESHLLAPPIDNSSVVGSDVTAVG